MRYRRVRVAGGTYFFTVVTHDRRPFLSEPENIDLLRNAFKYVMVTHPFSIDAISILPDHIHSIWTLPLGDSNFSTRWRLVKSYFTRHCQQQYRGERSASRFDKQEQAVWQRRFWEHQIKDDLDFTHHFDYIHYNPVKHGLVAAPKDWQFSSFHHHVRAGIYSLNWGSSSSSVGWVSRLNPTYIPQHFEHSRDVGFRGSTQPTYPNILNILEMLGYFVPKGYANEAQPNLHTPTF